MPKSKHGPTHKARVTRYKAKIKAIRQQEQAKRIQDIITRLKEEEKTKKQSADQPSAEVLK